VTPAQAQEIIAAQAYATRVALNESDDHLYPDRLDLRAARRVQDASAAAAQRIEDAYMRAMTHENTPTITHDEDGNPSYSDEYPDSNESYNLEKRLAEHLRDHPELREHPEWGRQHEGLEQPLAAYGAEEKAEAFYQAYRAASTAEGAEAARQQLDAHLREHQDDLRGYYEWGTGSADESLARISSPHGRVARSGRRQWGDVIEPGLGQHSRGFHHLCFL